MTDGAHTIDIGPAIDLFSRAALAVRPDVPFDRLAFAVLDGEATRVFEIDPTTGGTPAQRSGRRADYSTRLWPDGGTAFAAVDDAGTELDPQAPADRAVLDAGFRSTLGLPVRPQGRDAGLVLLSSRTPGAFGAWHAGRLAPMLEMLGIALERERLFARERARHARRARLAELLPMIAEALDIRTVFPGLSEAIQSVLPHDILTFALITPDRKGVRVQAATHEDLLALPEYRFTDAADSIETNWDFRIVRELQIAEPGVIRSRISPPGAPLVEATTRPGPAWTDFMQRAGVRSTLRVPIRVKGRPIGGLVFMSRNPDAYDEEDGAMAARIADHVALALAHQKLAEEEREIARARAHAEALEHRVEALTRELDRLGAHRTIGRSALWKRALADAARVAPTETTVLITGESGTGKEVLARFVHRGSPRANGPFVAINCAALPTELLESELFGHERGAFTGAVSSRAGTIERARGGVLFLDEVGEMSPPVQAKFLRVLQEREFQRLGGTRTLEADIRVVAATNRDPRRSIEAGEFREDLYYRLSVFEIHLPPLRERREDIPVLAEAFLEELAANVGRPAAGLSEDAREMLLAHAWPGNVRELRNAIERAVILCQGGLITREHLPMSLSSSSSAAPAGGDGGPGHFPAGGVALRSVERELIEKALARTRGNKSEAAKLLGVTRGQLYSMMRRHSLTTAKR